MPSITEIEVRQLRPGDKVVARGREVYTVLEILLRDENGQSAAIQWADGGRDARYWDGALLFQKIDVLR